MVILLYKNHHYIQHYSAHLPPSPYSAPLLHKKHLPKLTIITQFKMHSITNIIWGISNIAVEHPQTCKIAYNLEARFHSESFMSDASPAERGCSSLCLSLLGPSVIQSKVVSMQTPLYVDLSQFVETSRKKINLPPHIEQKIY